MDEILKNINDAILKLQSTMFVAAYNMEVEKAKSQNQGEIKGLELAIQIIQAAPMISLNRKEIDKIICIRRDRTYCGFIEEYKITVEKQ